MADIEEMPVSDPVAEDPMDKGAIGPDNEPSADVPPEADPASEDAPQEIAEEEPQDEPQEGPQEESKEQPQAEPQEEPVTDAPAEEPADETSPEESKGEDVQETKSDEAAEEPAEPTEPSPEEPVEPAYVAPLMEKESNLNRISVKVNPVAGFFSRMFVPEERRVKEGVTSTVCTNPTAWFHAALLLHHEPIRMGALELQKGLTGSSTLSQIKRAYVWNAVFYSALLKFHFDQAVSMNKLFEDEGITVPESLKMNSIKVKAASADFKASQYNFDFTKTMEDEGNAVAFSNASDAAEALRSAVFSLLEAAETELLPQIKEKVEAGTFTEDEYFTVARFYFEHDSEIHTSIVCPWLMDSAKIWMSEENFDAFMRRDLREFGDKILQDWYPGYESMNRALIDSVFDIPEYENPEEEMELIKKCIKYFSAPGVSSTVFMDPANDVERFLVACAQSYRDQVVKLNEMTSEAQMTEENLEWKADFFFKWFDQLSSLMQVYDSIASKGLYQTAALAKITNEAGENLIPALSVYEDERWAAMRQALQKLSEQVKMYDPSTQAGLDQVPEEEPEAKEAPEGGDAADVPAEGEAKEEGEGDGTAEEKSLAEPADIEVGFNDKNVFVLKDNLPAFRETVRKLAFGLTQLMNDQECILGFYLGLVSEEEVTEALKSNMVGAIQSSQNFYKFLPAILKEAEAMGGEEFVLKFLPEDATSPPAAAGKSKKQKQPTGLSMVAKSKAKHEQEFVALENVVKSDEKPAEEEMQRIREASAGVDTPSNVADSKGCCIVS